MDTEFKNHERHVAVLGLNHNCGSIDLRDRICFSKEQIPNALLELVQLPDVSEALILSTCNRIELYVVTKNLTCIKQQLITFLSSYHNIDATEIEKFYYYFNCKDAITHIFRVVSSIDSLVIGESQILAQVKEAYKTACNEKTTGQILNKLLHFAIAAGKRVRTETKIGEGIVSIASAAVDLAKKIIGDPEKATAMIIGAGEMSELTARHLKDSGIQRIYFANRTIERAQELALKTNSTPISLNMIEGVIKECDIIISSTGAPHYILSTKQIRNVMSLRKNKPLFLIDIAAPRDIEPGAGKLFNVFLYSIDDLAAVVTENTRQRETEVENARLLLDEEIEKYVFWYNSLHVLPTLVNLRKSFELIRDQEIQRYSKELTSLPIQVQETFKQFASSLTEKFLYVPSKTLKDRSSDKNGKIFTETLIDLFNLNDYDEPT